MTSCRPPEGILGYKIGPSFMCGKKKKNLLKGEHRLCRIYKYKAMSVVACPPTPNGETNSVR